VNDISDMISFDQPWSFILNDCYVLTKDRWKCTCETIWVGRKLIRIWLTKWSGSSF